MRLCICRELLAGTDRDPSLTPTLASVAVRPSGHAIDAIEAEATRVVDGCIDGTVEPVRCPAAVGPDSPWADLDRYDLSWVSPAMSVFDGGAGATVVPVIMGEVTGVISTLGVSGPGATMMTQRAELRLEGDTPTVTITPIED